MMNRHFIGELLISRWFFFDTKSAWFWLAVRIYVGYQWLIAGMDKISNPAWVGSEAGSAVIGFLNRALEKAGGAHPDVSAGYAFFIENVVLPQSFFWSNMVAYGEFFVGVGLILGAFTGLAAFFGAFMNLNYMLAGTVSVNPILFTLSLFILLAWRVAGYWGLDNFLMKSFSGGLRRKVESVSNNDL